VKNQLGNVMNLRAFTIGISAAFLALACSGSDDNGNDNDPGSDNNPPVTGPTVSTPVVDPPVTGPTTTTPVRDPSTAPDDITAAYVESMLRTTCGECHGAAAQDNCRAGMCYIEDIEELIAQGKITPGDPNASLLYQRISRGEMPPAGNDPLNDDQIQQIATFILKLKPPIQQICDDQFMSWDDVYTAIQSDLVQADADDRVFFRYVSLANRYNAGVCDADLEADRWAMNKFFNSVSQNAGVQKAVEVPGANKALYRIDLREYDLDVTNGPFDPNALVGGPFVDGWEAIINNNNFAVEFQGDEAAFAILETGTTVPLMFSDAIIDEASVGNLYYELLKLAANRDDQLALFQIDLVANQDEASSVFIGTTKSEISEQEAFIRRDEIEVAGSQYYYERFDLDPDVAGESILVDPLGFFDVANGSQAVFSLPNGLQGYMIFDAAGIRQETSVILFDQFQNNNEMATNSCGNCHTGGLLQVSDEVRDYAELNSIDVANGIAQLNVDNGTDFEFSDVTDLYRDNAEIKEIITTDSGIYRSALGRAGVPLNGSDPISDTFFRFDRDVLIADVAGDLLFGVEGGRISPADALAENIARLDPALAGLDNGVPVDRDDWKGLYVNTLCITSVSEDNRPLAQECIDAGAL